MNKFYDLREKYPTFLYKDFFIEKTNNYLEITYTFKIPNLTTFHPQIKIPTKGIKINTNDKFLTNLIFHLGLVEIISYVKCTCSPNIIIEAGYINEQQISWFKKLYYYGLGEFLYINNINISEEELFSITCLANKEQIITPNYQGNGNLIPIGGGKDSCVSLEILKNYKDNNCFIINPKEITLNCAKTANYNEEQIIGLYRIIDKNLIKLNQEGFLNGHTPFSAIVAFSSYITAYLYNKQYIVLSNESSANEATVLGTKINHQYSKSYEFEKDFYNYTQKYFKINIHYFSLLRPLTEFQIGMLFSQYKQYHHIFKSCNVGSKEKQWKWCCSCPKCLFVYSILSPFLTEEEIIKIFGENMFNKKELLPIFLELLGYSKTKPFECVGTYQEVRYAISLTIKNTKNNLPILLKYFQDNYPLELEHNYKQQFNNEHNIPKEYIELLRKELQKYAK